MSQREGLRRFDHLALFLTENCNLRCEYCFAQDRVPRNLPRELAFRALDELLAWGEGASLAVTFWGGEPMLRRDLLRDLVLGGEERAQARGATITFSLPTNATLLTAEDLDFFRAHRVGFSLSADGLAETQGARRTAAGQNSFPLVERALDLVAAHYAEGRRPAIRMTVSPAAAAHLAENVAHYLDRGFDYIVLGPVVEAAWDEAALAALREGLAAVGARLAADLRARRPFPPVFLPLGTMLRACRLRDLGEPLGRRGCGAGVSLVAMDVEGALYPCHRFVFYDRRGPSRHRLGHLGEGARHERAPYDRPHREGELPQCAACVARGVCEYFCVAVSYAQEGRIDAIPESVCRLQRVSAEVALALHGELAGEPRYVSHLASLSGRASEATLRLLEEGRRDPGRLAEAALERLARLRRPGCGGRDERVPPPEVEA